VSGVFISYRREDSQGLAGRLFDRLVQRFGEARVFWDIDSIDPGGRFAEVIAERIGGCDALVALRRRRPWASSALSQPLPIKKLRGYKKGN